MATDVGDRLRILLDDLRRRWGYEADRQLSAFARHLGTRHSTILGWQKTGRIGMTGRRILAVAIDTSEQNIKSYLEGQMTLEELLRDNESIGATPTVPVSQYLRQIRNLLKLVDISEVFLLLIDIGTLLKNSSLKSIDPEQTAIEQPQTIQQCILQELSKFDRPWSDSPAPLSVFADEVQLELDELMSILGGRRPTSDELSRLAQVLTHDRSGEEFWDLKDLTDLVKQQYKATKHKPTDE
jgi:hypothetical protein